MGREGWWFVIGCEGSSFFSDFYVISSTKIVYLWNKS